MKLITKYDIIFCAIMVAVLFAVAVLVVEKINVEAGHVPGQPTIILIG